MRLVVWAILLLVCCFSVAAAEMVPVGQNPLLQSGGVSLSSDAASIAQAISDKVNANNDANMQFLDERTRSLEKKLMDYDLQLQQKLIVGAVGVNLLVAGLVYYFLIKRNRDLSYESVALKRKKEIDDRNFMADTINEMRIRFDDMEAFMKTQVQPSLFTLEQLAQQRRYQYGRGEQPGSQQQAPSGYGGGSQGFGADIPMANQGYVPQPSQGQGYAWQQYEQPPASQGWNEGAYYSQGYDNGYL